MSNTKFIICIYGLTILALAVAFGGFTGELGLYVSAIVGAYVGGNTLITRKALENGKDPNGV